MAKTSKAQIEASNKYNKEHYAKIQANINKSVFNGACKFCYISGMSKAQLITQSIRKYIFDEMISGNWNDSEIKNIAEAFEIDIKEIEKLRNEAAHTKDFHYNVLISALNEKENSNNESLINADFTDI